MKALINKHYIKQRETIHNFTWRSLQLFGKQGITFLIFILSAKLLSPYDFGVYNYVLAIIFLLVMFADFGISTAASKYVAEYNITDKEKLKGVLYNGVVIISGLTFLISLGVIFLGEFYLKDKYIYVLYLLPMFFFAPLTSLYDGIYRGLKRFKQLAVISLSIGFIFLFFAYYIILYFGLVGALIFQDVFYVVLFLGLAFGYREFYLKFNKQVAIEIGSYSFVFGLAVLGYYLFSRVDILILGHYGYIQEIGTYELLNKIFMISLLPMSIIGQVIAPNFTELHAKGEYHLIFSSLKRFIFSFIIMSLLFALLTYFILPVIFSHFLSTYFTGVFWAMLLPVVFIYAIQFYGAAINGGIIVSIGYAKLMTYINILLGVLNFILSLILLKYFGYIGVIYATLFSNAFGIVILHTLFYKKIFKLSTG